MTPRHFRVLKPCTEFTAEEFRIVGGTSYVVHIVDSNLERYSISPLVVDMRLASGHIQEITPPPEEPAREILGPDSFGGEDYPLITTQPGPQLEVKDGPGPSSRNHPWKKD